ncbi:hypothetical protein D9757_000042 [Collybiopsis confluens]|uniref:Uncharacterized protein n=1 Tax=Collybiopsis confluens TaxID=2823264 RepID=A0A8H5I274_9AGAR|nr:hypothetical protein D9757_000042 [Collybiopsis confluens]
MCFDCLGARYSSCSSLSCFLLFILYLYSLQMSSSSPSLGSLGIQAPSLTPQIVYVSSETCMDLSLFKAIMREYRALDDGIHMRLNRTLAFEQERLRQKTNLGKSVEAQACLRLWQELVSNWGRRNQLIEYCVTVVDQSTKVKQGILDSRDTSPSAMRKARAEEYSEQVKASVSWAVAAVDL